MYSTQNLNASILYLQQEYPFTVALSWINMGCQSALFQMALISTLEQFSSTQITKAMTLLQWRLSYKTPREFLIVSRCIQSTLNSRARLQYLQRISYKYSKCTQIQLWITLCPVCFQRWTPLATRLASLKSFLIVVRSFSVTITSRRDKFSWAPKKVKCPTGLTTIRLRSNSRITSFRKSSPCTL